LIDARTLARLTSRRRIRTAICKGRIVRDGWGKYALPTADHARRVAHGVVSHTSVAAHYGWEMKHPPERPTVTVYQG
jgi:hypothetical protein